MIAVLTWVDNILCYFQSDEKYKTLLSVLWLNSVVINFFSLGSLQNKKEASIGSICQFLLFK